jgi:hypothetical protein
MKTILRGLLAGLLAGLVLVCLLFVDDVPGKQLVFVARWFDPGGEGASAWAGALQLLILAGLTGGIFGDILYRWGTSLTRLLLLGLIAGLVWWFIVVLLVAIVVERLEFSAYDTLLYLALSLLYGMLLGNLYAKLGKSAR